MNPEYIKARQLALVLLKGEPNPDPPTIRRKVRLAIATVQADTGPASVAEDALVREIESLCAAYLGDGTALDAHEQDHIIWLPQRRASITWRFWRRYERYMEEEEGRPPAVVSGLDRQTDMILERLEDPHREGRWDIRGLVVGRVQSGKTANYTGLICKSLDAGYKLVIVLSGMHKSLRSQTQLRLDEGVLGFDTERSRSFQQDFEPIGVGKLQRELLTIHPLTNSADNGDFNRRVANQATPMFGGNDPFILVVKKNKSVLENLRLWAMSVRGTLDPTTGKKVVRDIPMLLIDDEADSASVNTKDIPRDSEGNAPDDYDVSAINGKIRELLDLFARSAYVGYTATPFANIFIDSDGRTERHGDDIFPRNFILNLPAPSYYVGATRVFGQEADGRNGADEVPALPIVRIVDDYQESFPIGHRKEHEPAYLPQSLRTAIRAFILVCAARRAAGQETAHNSMLIHVTRYVQVQGRIGELVQAELNRLRRLLEYGSGEGASLVGEMEALWKSDFEDTTRRMLELDPPVVEWEQVREQLYSACAPIDVKILNGTAQDVLDYLEYRDTGRSVIAIGGDKLSRGLTLEGLSVSYYLRTARMYDTLMQMGRWFGYRPGYLHLCRLFTTEELVNWYRHISLASEELLREFDAMAAVGATPEEYGLRVRTHPDGLLITAMNKMRSGTDIQISYAGDIVELPHYHTDAETVARNFRAACAFLESLGTSAERDGRLWRDVPGEQVANFLSGLSTHRFAIKANAQRVAEYIRRQMLAHHELERWTVALISSSRPGAKDASFAGTGHVGLIERGNERLSDDVYTLKNSRLISPTDEYLDFDTRKVQRALEETRARHQRGEIKGKEPRTPNGRVVREMRSSEEGLLLLYPLDPQHTRGTDPVMGYAISFPASERAERVEYRVNRIYMDSADNDDEL